MKKILFFFPLLLSQIILCQNHIEQTLNKYKTFLENGTYQNQDWSIFKVRPLSRYESFKYAFELFEQINGKVVVELGTTRSFTHGGVPEGCNTNNSLYWTPNSPENWDWGAGFFTRMAAESLAHLNPVIHTIDLESTHINRCRIINGNFNNIQFHVTSSFDFLRQATPYSIDLLYLDTGNMTPIEDTAQMQLAEAKIIVERNVLSPNGIILIDDVRNQVPREYGDTSGLGKAKYSIHYFLANGYELLMDEYQVILRRRKS